MASPAIGLALLVILSMVQAQHFLLQELLSPANSTDDTDKRPSCVLINNYCGKVVPNTGGMKKECCGDLICYKNKCRRRTCC